MTLKDAAFLCCFTNDTRKSSEILDFVSTVLLVSSLLKPETTWCLVVIRYFELRLHVKVQHNIFLPFLVIKVTLILSYGR